MHDIHTYIHTYVFELFSEEVAMLLKLWNLSSKLPPSSFLPAPQILSNSSLLSSPPGISILNRRTPHQAKMGAGSAVCSPRGAGGREDGEDRREEQRFGSPSMGVVLPALEPHALRAASALSEGHVIAMPTDTLYGLAADAWYAIAQILKFVTSSTVSYLLF
jgi:hypothetical protein